MGTIGSYYQLANLLSNSTGGGTSSSTSSSSTNPTQALMQALETAGSASSGSGSSAYLLDLSPQAQQLLGSNSASASSASGTSTNFVLSQTQQTAIKNIIAQYKDAPLDQNTFNEIQSALQAAGLSPQTLGAEDQVQSFNSTNVLLQALSGNYTSVQTPGTDAANEQTKEANYMQSIVSIWKAENASTSSVSGTSSSGTVPAMVTV